MIQLKYLYDFHYNEVMVLILCVWAIPLMLGWANTYMWRVLSGARYAYFSGRVMRIFR